MTIIVYILIGLLCSGLWAWYAANHQEDSTDPWNGSRGIAITTIGFAALWPVWLGVVILFNFLNLLVMGFSKAQLIEKFGDFLLARLGSKKASDETSEDIAAKNAAASVGGYR